MKINIDKEKCIHCGTCVALFPEHFRFDDKGEIEIIDPENIPPEIIKKAVNSCPVQAISFEE